MRLLSLNIQHVKGIKRYNETFNGRSADIIAENGRGKTSIYDSLLWLLFGKDSKGRTGAGVGSFDLRPTDEHNNIIEGLTCAVEAEFSLGTDTITLRREHHEKMSKGEIKGYTTKYYIDGDNYKAKEYEDCIKKLFDEDKFKLYTNIFYFNEQLHWNERRKILLELAGDIGEPEGFEDVLEDMAGRTREKYKKKLDDRKSELVEQRDDIEPRLDEKHKDLSEEGELPVDTLKEEREEILESVAALKNEKHELQQSQSEYQKKTEAIASLKVERVARERELELDTSNCEKLFEERKSFSGILTKKQQELNDLHEKACAQVNKCDDLRNNIKELTKKLDAARQKRDKWKEQKAEDTCFNCGQKLPKETQQENQDAYDEQMNILKTEVTTVSKQLKEAKIELQTEEEEANKLRVSFTVMQKEHEDLKKNTQTCIADIDKKIQNRDRVKPEDDETWRDMSEKLKKMEQKAPFIWIVYMSVNGLIRTWERLEMIWLDVILR